MIMQLVLVQRHVLVKQDLVSYRILPRQELDWDFVSI